MSKLREFREQANLSQVELGKFTQIAHTAISDFERGTRTPWPKARQAIAQVLGQPEDAIFPNNDRTPQPDPHIVKKLRRDTVYAVESFLEDHEIALFYTYMKGDERLVGDRANTDIIRRVLGEDE